MNFFSKKNILITGASGYIGSTVAKALSRFDCRLHLLSRRDNQVFDITKKKFLAVSFEKCRYCFPFCRPNQFFFCQ